MYRTILSQYRRQHSFILERSQELLGSKVKELDVQASVVARLKRADTIIEKLKYNKTMCLARMYDIAGCRIITPNLETQQRIIDYLKGDLEGFKNLQKNKNYLCLSKKDGYRGYHLVYEYDGNKEDYKTLKVELQIRTEIQNIWATTLEVVDFMSSTKLKRGIKDDYWSDFFCCVSNLFRKVEEGVVITPLEKESLKSYEENIKELGIYSKIPESIVKLDNEELYYVLKLYKENDLVVLSGYSFANMEEANSKYESIELDNFEKEEKINVVLISPQSLKTLKETYLNYFIDIKKFLTLLNKIC